MSRRLNEWPAWPSERAWIGIGIYALTIMILWMIKEDPTLRNDEFFKTIATAIIITGFINGVISWAYSATQGGQELANRNANLLEQKENKMPDDSRKPGLNRKPSTDAEQGQAAIDAAEETAEAAVEQAEEIRDRTDG